MAFSLASEPPKVKKDFFNFPGVTSASFLPSNPRGSVALPLVSIMPIAWSAINLLRVLR
jgi:hypothetical protein